jgi:hypothetical protein
VPGGDTLIACALSDAAARDGNGVCLREVGVCDSVHACLCAVRVLSDLSVRPRQVWHFDPPPAHRVVSSARADVRERVNQVCNLVCEML